MRVFCIAVLLTLSLTPAALAQGPVDYHKIEIAGSYQYGRLAPNSGEEFYTVNYNPIFARDRNIAGNTDSALRVAGRRADNFTFGVGIVIH